MATTQELSEQLAVTQKLAAAVDQMAKSLARVESSYDTQISSVEKLTKAIETLSGQDFSKLNSNKLDGVQKELKDTAKGVTSLTGRLTDLGKNMSKKFPVAAAAGAAALSGLVQGIRNVVALGKSVAGFFASFVSGAASIAASIIAIPFKMFNALVDTAAAAGAGMNELAQAVENLRKEFGDLKGPSSKAVLDMTKNVGDFSATGLSAFRVFGTMAERLEAMTKLAAALGNAFEITKDQVAKMGLALPAFQKGLGLSDEAMKSLAERSVTMGDSLEKTFVGITKQSTELGKAFNLSQKTIARDMGKASVDVKHFGQLTVKEIGVAAVYAKKLGVELEKITGTLDAFETFDSAAENASKLSQSFGLTVDAFKLMDAQNPADQLDMLRKSMKAAGQSTETMTRQQLKLLAQTTGLDEATAKLAFSSKNEGVSLDQIRKKSGEAEKKTLTQAEAMGKLADSIERMVKAGGGQEGGFWQQFFKGFLGGIQATKEFRDIIWNIKKSLQLTYFEGVRLGKAFVQIFPGVKMFLGGIADFFNPAKFKKLTHGVTDVIIEFMKGLTDPNSKASFSWLMDNIKKKFFDFFDASSPSGQKTIAGFKSMMKAMSKILSEGIKWIADKMSVGILAVVDLLTGKTSLSSIGAKAGGGIGFLAQILEPMAKALGHAWTVLKDPMILLIATLFKKLKEFLMSDTVRSIIKPAIIPLAAMLFGPMFSRAILATITTSIGKVALKGIMSSFAKKAGVATLEKAGSAGLSKLGAATGIGAIIAAGAAIGKGVNTYTDNITSTMEHSSKVIAAGAAGLVDALTLGLLPDDLMLNLANTFGEIVDQVYLAMQNVFGAGFATSFKRKLAGTFELIGSIYDVIAKLFTGNQSDFDSSMKELGFAVLRFVTDALEMTFIQLPIILLKLTSQILSSLVSVIVKLVTVQFSVLAGAVDKTFGTHLSEKIDKVSDDVRKGIESANKATLTYLEYGASSVSNATKEMQDKYLRSAADQAKQAKQASDQVIDAAAGTQADANKRVQKQMETAISAADMSKTTDIAKNVEEYTKSVSKINDSISSSGMQQAIDNISTTVKKTQELDAALSSTLSKVNATSAADNIASYAKSLAKFSGNVVSGGMNQALGAVGEMIKKTQELDNALAAAPNMNVDARLQKLASATGIGGKFSYSVKSKDVVINLNLNITMDVGEAEKIMIMRKSSIIRDRLEFATGAGTHGDQATPAIPETYTPAWNIAPTKV